jgi:hypothetical protein
MSDNNNENVVNFAHRVKSEIPKSISIRNFYGFDYIKIDKDLNGNPLIKESLLEYANCIKYIVRVLREQDNKVFLYDYYVPQYKLARFLLDVENGKFDGQVIEVEKYIPEDLA